MPEEQYEIPYRNITLKDISILQSHRIGFRGVNEKNFAYNIDDNNLDPKQKKVLENLCEELSKRG